MTAPIHGGFTESEMLAILERGCAAAGLDSAGAVLMRGQTNAVIRLASRPVVVKIARKGTPVDEVARTVTFVRWLMDLGFPTVPLHRPDLQPVVADGNAISLWTYLPQPDRTVPAQALAKPLNILHSLSEPPVALKPLDVCGAIRRSLSRTTTLSQEDLLYLHQRADVLERRLGSVSYELQESVLQGDPQHGNALHDGHRAVLCDWDSIAVGHPEWDLVTVEVHCRRFGYGNAHYADFAEAYGWDVTQWAGYPVLRDLRELRMITTNARKATHEPAKAAEVVRRIHGFRAGDLSLEWNIL
ncbi:phosphotransferase family protein [Streptomyces sp. H27-D2]|uniref:phosphotransferase family protein n=1 Tax=Streptomyces sp. H27-D2 TaxID=3046304 RepID=UPI002DB5A359|nr:phosphotransferase [Streptomyces sp. H27-D2]MEC4020489.1 phosphotransferase [Streptomyces sp. H27-D2]